MNKLETHKLYLSKPLQMLPQISASFSEEGSSDDFQSIDKGKLLKQLLLQQIAEFKTLCSRIKRLDRKQHAI